MMVDFKTRELSLEKLRGHVTTMSLKIIRCVLKNIWYKGDIVNIYMCVCVINVDFSTT